MWSPKQLNFKFHRVYLLKKKMSVLHVMLFLFPVFTDKCTVELFLLIVLFKSFKSYKWKDDPLKTTYLNSIFLKS